jgi:hypothetical protein
MPASLAVLDSGLAGALILYGLPATASIGAVLVYHAISIWVPAVGGLIAWLSTRRAGTVEHPTVGPSALATLHLAEGDRSGRLTAPGQACEGDDRQRGVSAVGLFTVVPAPSRRGW